MHPFRAVVGGLGVQGAGINAQAIVIIELDGNMVVATEEQGIASMDIRIDFTDEALGAVCSRPDPGGKGDLALHVQAVVIGDNRIIDDAVQVQAQTPSSLAGYPSRPTRQGAIVPIGGRVDECRAAVFLHFIVGDEDGRGRYRTERAQRIAAIRCDDHAFVSVVWLGARDVVDAASAHQGACGDWQWITLCGGKPSLIKWGGTQRDGGSGQTQQQ